MSRQVTTMLFADIVDSTAAVARLGDIRWAALVAQRRETVASLLTTHDGREIGSSGDDVLAVFDMPLDALRCALALREALDELGLRVRAGVHCGEIEISGAEVAGLNVHVAARVMAAADAGQILVTSTVRELVGGAGATFTDRGRHVLRGLDDDWQLFELATLQPPSPRDAAEATSMRWPLPTAPAAAESVPLLGRETEMVRLTELWRAAAGGSGRAVLVAGEPGGGKTRLLADLARAVYDEGGLVLWGRCDEGLSVPFQPIVEALGDLASHSSPRQLRHLFVDDAAELARLVPRVRHLLPTPDDTAASDPGTQQYQLFEATAAVLRRTTAQVPTLLVVDDTHWATRPTLHLLRHLVERSPGMRLMIALAYRDTAPDLDEELLDWLAYVCRLPGVDRIVLDGLTEDAVTSLVDVLVVDAATPQQCQELARRVHRRTAGNPFFTTQVLRHLGETADGGPEDAHPPLPPAVVDVISQRLLRLPSTTRRVLREAAVLGQQFSLDVLAAMLPDLALQEVLHALDAGIEANLINEDATARLRYRFTHALVVDAIVDASPRGWLREAHLRAAAAWESVPVADRATATTELARHHGAASLDPVKEYTYAQAAAAAAMASLAFGDAVPLYRQAAAAAERAQVEPAECAELRLALAVAEAAAGLPGYRQSLEAAWDAAQEVGDQDLLVRAALAVIRGNWSSAGEVDRRRLQVLEAALASGALPDPQRARLLAQLATELNWSQSDRARREALAAEALALAPTIDNVNERLRMIGQCASGVQHPDSLAAITAVLDDYEPLLDEMTDPVLALQAGWTWLTYAGIRADRERVQRHIARMEALADCQPVPHAVYLATWIRLTIQFLEGRFDDVLAGCTRLVELGAALGQSEAESIAAYYYLLIGHLRGDTRELLPLLEAYADQYRDGLPGLRAAVAWFHASAGDPATAARILDELAGDDFAVLRQDQATILWLAWAADTAHRLDARDHAQRLYEILTPYADQLAFNGGYMVGSVQHWLGLLATTTGDVAAAERHLLAGLALHGAWDMTYWTYASRAAIAAGRLRRGDSTQRPELVAVRQLAADAGYRSIVNDIDALLAPAAAEVPYPRPLPPGLPAGTAF